jgi:hypothetical protein
MSSRLSGTTTLGIQPFLVPSTAALKPPGLSFRSRSQCSCAFFPPVGTLLNNGALHRDVFAPHSTWPSGPSSRLGARGARGRRRLRREPAQGGREPRGVARRSRWGARSGGQAGPAGRRAGRGGRPGRPSRPVPRSGAGSPPGADGTGQQRLAAVCWPGPPQIATERGRGPEGQVRFITRPKSRTMSPADPIPAPTITTTGNTTTLPCGSDQIPI